MQIIQFFFCFFFPYFCRIRKQRASDSSLEFILNFAPTDYKMFILY